jgi:nitroreductase
MLTINSRTADYEIDPLFLERWSPRAYTGAPMPDATLKSIFEAARWAPSSYNSQPWRFIYAKRDTPAWPTLLGLLGEGNQVWAKNAAVLMILVSKKTMMVPGKDVPIESYSHSLDAGAAWASLALQAAKLGWDAHGMVGYDQTRAATELKIPADHRVEIAIAIGKRGDKATLPEPLAAREAPSPRRPQAEFTFEGEFHA